LGSSLNDFLIKASHLKGINNSEQEPLSLDDHITNATQGSASPLEEILESSHQHDLKWVDLVFLNKGYRGDLLILREVIH
jgi:hypothetical protein